MQSHDIMELLSDIISDTDRERADFDPTVMMLKAVASDLYQKIFQNMIP